jgi:hypothetical protein
MESFGDVGPGTKSTEGYWYLPERPPLLRAATAMRSVWKAQRFVFPTTHTVHRFPLFVIAVHLRTPIPACSGAAVRLTAARAKLLALRGYAQGLGLN